MRRWLLERTTRVLAIVVGTGGVIACRYGVYGSPLPGDQWIIFDGTVSGEDHGGQWQDEVIVLPDTADAFQYEQFIHHDFELELEAR